MNPKQIASYTGGDFLVAPIDGSELITGITWDSRDVHPGDLFVALPGETVDGHQFLGAALHAGARCALVMRPIDHQTNVLAQELGTGVIEVANTQTALTDLARAWRPFLRGRVIALTGSSGKTTTKNLIRDVLASAFSTVATAGNQNNELGVPKTLLSANPETEAVIVEMGMRGLGQISALCDFVRPDWGLITNVGESHIELLGSRENIARAKNELLCALPDGTGIAFVNAADDFAAFCITEARCAERHVAVCRYDGSWAKPGASGDAQPAAQTDGAIDLTPHVWASDVRLDDEGCPHFILHVADSEAPCSLNLRGLHNVANACAAAAVGAACNMGVEAIAEALRTAQPEAGRQEVIKARAGFTVVNDAYNANPESMRASLLTFCSWEFPGKRYAVLGDMGELGDYAEACHDGIGRLVATLPIDYLICIGPLARRIGVAADEEGMDTAKIFFADTIADVLGELDVRLVAGDGVLVKASHAAGLTRVVEGLIH